MLCTCGLATHVRAAYFLAPANMCARANPPARLQPPPPTPRLPKIPSPHSGPGTHSDRSLIHIFLLGADFSSSADGQSDSSISGGLRGDSSMLSFRLWSRRRREHRGSASAPSRKTLTPTPAPSHLRLARTSQAGVSRLGPSRQSCSSCGSSSPAAQLSSGFPGPSSPRRRRRRALPEPPPRVSPPPPAGSPSLCSPTLLCLAARLSLLAAAPPPPRGKIGSRGHTRIEAPLGGHTHPGARDRAGGCECVFTECGAGGGRTSVWVPRGFPRCVF